MSDTPCISLITDFGYNSPFVGVMKAVILSHAPNIRMIDILHDVAAFNVDEGGFWLAHSYYYLPDRSVHVAVVDPGVGSARDILAARYNDHLFLAPDNGLFDQCFADAAEVEYRELDMPHLQERLQIAQVSSTFHGRDIFAPVAAALALGQCRFDELGPQRSQIRLSDMGRARHIGHCVQGAVVSIDHYGNIISNIEAEYLVGHADAWLACAGHRFQIKKTYADARIGEDIAVVNSFGVLEIARAQGNAAERLGIHRGAQVTLHLQ